MRVGGFDGPVFPDSRGGWRDASNVGKVFRAVRGGSSFEWAKTPTYRKTLADRLGHSRVSMTQDVTPAGGSPHSFPRAPFASYLSQIHAQVVGPQGIEP